MIIIIGEEHYYYKGQLNNVRQKQQIWELEMTLQIECLYDRQYSDVENSPKAT